MPEEISNPIMIRDISTCKELLDRIMAEAEAIINLDYAAMSYCGLS